MLVWPEGCIAMDVTSLGGPVVGGGDAADRRGSRARRGGGQATTAVARYGCHAGSMGPLLVTTNEECGATGSRRSRRSVSWRYRFSLRALHGRHDATTFSQVCSPPRDRGITWSMFSAGRLQYWHRCSSRANTARRESGTRLRYGTRTKCTSRMTDGHGTFMRAEWSSAT